MKPVRKPSAKEGNFLYFILSIILLFIGSYVQGRSLWIGLIITQYVLILVPPIVFLKIKKYSLRDNLRLNRTSFKNIILAILITIFTYPIAIFFNLLGIIFIETFGRTVASPIPTVENLGQLVMQLIVVAVSPAICEELMFRGFLMRSYEGMGRKRAIIYSAILFGIFHFNLQNLLGPIVLGLVFGAMVIKTDSILVSMVGHMTNNAIAIFIGYGISGLVKSQELLEPAVDIAETNPDLLFLILALGIISILALVVVVSLLRQLDGPSYGREKSIGIGEDSILYINEQERVGFKNVLPIVFVLLMYSIFNYRIFFL